MTTRTNHGASVEIGIDPMGFGVLHEKPASDIRQVILADLCRNKPGGVSLAYRLAVIAVCDAIEANADPEELWSAGVMAEDLTTSHRIGEHLSATRRFFGLVC